MAHKKKIGIYRWNKKKANHGKMGAKSLEKSDFTRAFRRKDKKYLKAHA